MSRLRIVIPLLFSSLALPASGEPSTSYCQASMTSPRCEAERAREFAAARNAEINASIAAVEAARFAAARNAEIDASIAAVKAERARAQTAATSPAGACQRYNWLTASCDGGRNGTLAAVELALATTHCKTVDSTTPRCEAERAREFAAERNAEVDASIAAVKAERARAESERRFAAERNAEIDASLAAVNAERRRTRAAANLTTASVANTSCRVETPDEFAAARNAEIDASIARVEAVRRLALTKTHCKTLNSATPRCEAERAREFAAARNAEIEASIAAVKAERERAFAAARNAEINASIAAVEAARFAIARNAEIEASIDAVERAFAAARNAEIDASVALVAFVRERNAEIDASIATVNTERERAFAAARNAEIEASIAAVKAERERVFAAARNAEIDAVLAAYYAQRALRLAMEDRHPSHINTGAISLPDVPVQRSLPSVRRMNYVDPCREAGRAVSPLQFSAAGTMIEQSMKPALDRLAEIARNCPAVRIEIHGYSDAAAPAQVSRSLADRRARLVLEYLVVAGVAPERMTTFGHGAAEPLRTAELAAASRRVEIKITDPALETVAARIMYDLAELLDPGYVPTLARLGP